MSPKQYEDDATRTVDGVAADSGSGSRDPETPAAAQTGAGKHLGRFVLQERIGAGGMGVVYRATDKMLSRDVAIKVLNSGGASPERRLRMQREAQAMAALSHPNLVTVYDAGIDGDEFFIAMELVRGSDLSAWLKAEQRDWADIRRVFLAAGRGLEAAHDAGIVHRDFKPSNVLIGDNGRVQVADFGVALTNASDDDTGDPSTGPVKLTKTGVALGTPKYMSPEQHEARKLDVRSDQFSFALTLAEAAYGEHPFAAGSYRELVHNVLDGEPNLPADQGPAGLEPILRRALSRGRGDRYATMTDMLSDLERIGESRTRPWLITASMLGLVVLGVAAVMAGRATGAAMTVSETVQPMATQPAPTRTRPTPRAVISEPAVDAGASPTTTIDAGVAPATTADASAPVRVAPRTRRTKRRPNPTPAVVDTKPDAGVPENIEPTKRIGAMVYTGQRCKVDHASQTCGKCCKTRVRSDEESHLLMPYPNCGCYYDENARKRRQRLKAFRKSTPPRIGNYIFRRKCPRVAGKAMCRNCCKSPHHKFFDFPVCGCYIDEKTWIKAGRITHPDY